MEAVLQSEFPEGGLSCLAVVANHHGQRHSLRDLRQCYPLSLKGANLGRVMSVAGQLGLQCRRLPLGLGELGQLKPTCVLHWGFNLFVVPSKVGKKKVTILDPAFGKRELSHAELSMHFTGMALELTPAA